MADIFISYSSKDKEKADQLTELLVSAGLSVWIDQSGIDVATSWSGEIVDAIEGCKAFVVLLSPNSIHARPQAIRHDRSRVRERENDARNGRLAIRGCLLREERVR